MLKYTFWLYYIDILNPPELMYDETEEKDAVGLTEEEERELAELMSDEED